MRSRTPTTKIVDKATEDLELREYLTATRKDRGLHQSKMELEVAQVKDERPKKPVGIIF